MVRLYWDSLTQGVYVSGVMRQSVRGSLCTHMSNLDSLTQGFYVFVVLRQLYLHVYMYLYTGADRFRNLFRYRIGTFSPMVLCPLVWDCLT